MIKKIITVIMMLLFVNSIPASMIFSMNNENKYNQTSVTYSFEEPVVKNIEINGNVYDQLNLQGAPCIGNPGEPSLPARGANILLPQGTKVADITVTTGRRVFLGEGYNIIPAEKPVRISEMNSISLPEPNEAIYSSENICPVELFTEIGTYNFRGYSILVLSLHPVQYSPFNGELFYYPELKVIVETTKDYNGNILFRELERDKQELIHKVDNPCISDTYITKNSPLSDIYDLLILTTDDLKNGFEPLKNKHDAIGETTIIKTLSDSGGSTESIREYIRNAYLDWGIDYVLIGGDENVVPAKRLYVDSTTMPSDLYYACLDGTYNYDNDSRWGEPTDGENGGDVDLVAEVYVGRACVEDATETAYFVDKTIVHMNLIFGDDFLNDTIMVGEYLGFGGVGDYGGNYMDELINGSSNNGYQTVGIPDEYDVNKLYDRDWDHHSWPVTEIIARINNGVHIVNHLGHGSPDYAMKMYNSDADELTNNDYCFVYSQTCLAGHFDGLDCFAEHMNVKTPHGAYALIMNARFGYGASYSTDGPSQRFNREFWDAIFGEDLSTIGNANHDSKEDNIWRINQACMRWCCYELNLFGDPTLDIIPSPEPVIDIEIGNITGGLFNVNAGIKNTGDGDATNVQWTIALNGKYILHGKTSKGTTNISAGETKEIQSEWIFGFGGILQPMEITVTAVVPESSDTKDTYAKLFLFLIETV